jgi:predicted Zn-dependent peptidase
VQQELRALCQDGPSEAEVEAARGQIRGSLLMAQESVSSRMYQLAHDELYHGRYIPPDEQVARILAVTREEVAEAARAFAAPERFALAAMGPEAQGPLSERDWPIESASGEQEQTVGGARPAG